MCSYNLKILWRMLHFMEDDSAAKARKNGKTWSPEQIKLVVSHLRGFLCTRKVYPRRVGDARKFLLKIFFKSNAMQKLKIRRVFADPTVSRLLPQAAANFTDQLLVCNRLVDPIGKEILNFPQVARKLPKSNNSGQSCKCSEHFGSCDMVDGHVLTGNLDFIKEPLRSLMFYGPQFREGMTRQKSLDSLKVSIDCLICDLAKDTQTDASDFKKWRNMVIAKCRDALGLTPTDLTRILGRATVAADLRWYQRHLVFVPADKAQNNITAVCKHLYISRLRAELDDATVYQRHDKTPDEVVEIVREELVKYNMGAPNKFSYLYWMPKLHKDGQRFIAGGALNITTEPSVLLSKILAAVLLALRAKDEQRIKSGGCKRLFVVDGYEEVSIALNRYRFKRSTDGSVCTSDFETMYTTLEHKDLIHKVGCVVTEAFAFMKPKRKGTIFVCEKSDGSFVLRRTSKTCYDKKQARAFSLSDVKWLIKFVISNTFILNDGVLRKQILGIPMGTNCAPMLANLYLYFYESRFVDKVALSDVTLARKMRMSFRLIDDLLTIDCPNGDDFLTKVYPKSLRLSRTNLSNREACFLGMRIRQPEGETKLHVDVYDKRNEFPFQVRNYPHTKSVVPRSQCYGVFTGQLHRFVRICSCELDFVKWALKIANYMAGERGYSKLRLLSTFGSFVCKGVKYPNMQPMVLIRQFKEGLLGK
jgi:hypothetical protein